MIRFDIFKFATVQNLFESFSGLYMKEKNFTSILSGIRRDIRGNIESASATTMKWMGRFGRAI